MSRVKEGTTLLGFKCDAAGCDAKATHTPVLFVPHEHFPTSVRAPLFSFIDTHVCMAHRRSIRGEDIMSKKMKDQFEAIAEMSNSKPAWKRAYVEFAPVHSSSYQKFQIAAGLVPPDDAQVKGEIIMPDLPGVH